MHRSRPFPCQGTHAMNQLSILPKDLDAILASARTMLDQATSAAQILDARERAQIAADIAKRMTQAKHAHEDVTNRAKALQGDAVALIAWADTRLADEYTAAQERGEVVGPHDGAKKRVAAGDPIATIADIGLSKQQMHNARIIRDAVKDDPEVIPKTIRQILSTGQQASLRGLVEAIKEAKENAPKSLKNKNPFRSPDYVKHPFADALLNVSGPCEELARHLAKYSAEDILSAMKPGLFETITLRNLRDGHAALNRFMEIVNAKYPL